MCFIGCSIQRSISAGKLDYTTLQVQQFRKKNRHQLDYKQ